MSHPGSLKMRAHFCCEGTGLKIPIEVGRGTLSPLGEYTKDDSKGSLLLVERDRVLFPNEIEHRNVL